MLLVEIRVQPKSYLMKGMWEHLQFILSRYHPGGDRHQDRGGLRSQGCT